MTRERKTEEEWTVMRYFMDKYADFPRGKLVKSESPDFLLMVNRRYTIGIELTQLETEGVEISSVGVLEVLLKEAIVRKEEKIGLYNKKILNEIWLIISTSTLALPSDSQVEVHLDRMRFDSGFDRLYLLDLFQGKFFMLT
jgi:hypothetical protein